MSHHWFHLNSGPGPAAHNMAVDEALLENSGSIGGPILRFYGWTEPAATFGYSQHYADIAELTRLRPLIRRMTGGGLVPHDADWTYSLIVPAGHDWYLLKATESYRRIHDWLRNAFAEIGVSTEVALCCRKELPGQCFVGWEKFDLLWQGKKIAGAAQRRNKQGLLIQGSVQPPPIGLYRGVWEQSMIGSARRKWNVEWKPYPVDSIGEQRIASLVAEKYGSSNHNQSR